MTDFKVGDTLHFLFTTRQFSDGVPTVLAGSPVLGAFEDAVAVPITAGVTVTVDVNSVAGLNRANIVATGANGFEAGKSYTIAITTGTVGGVSVVGEVVAAFSLGRSAAAQDLANTTDGLGAIKAETALIVGDTAGIAGAAMRGTDGVDTATMRGTDGASTHSAADVWTSGTRTLTAFSTALALAVWDVLESAIVVASSLGIKLKAFTFTVANIVDANLAAVDGATGVVAAFRRSLLKVHEGSVTTNGTVTTLIDTSLTHTDTDQLKGRIVIFQGNTTAGLRDQATDITAFNPATDEITFTAVTVAPVVGDQYIIV